MNDKNLSFLEEVVEDLYQQYGKELAKCTIMLPTLRSAEVLQHVVSRKAYDLATLPQVMTVEAWVIQHSKLTLASVLELAVLLYQFFQELTTHKEPFEKFYGWGCMLLQDFDILDKCLVDPDQLFANLYEQKVLAPRYEHLSEAQQQAIKSFWNSFGGRLSIQQQDFLQLWKLLPHLYKRFTAYLLKNGKGYLGLCYRKLCNTLDNKLLSNYQQIAIVGFNALHPAEEKLFAWLRTHTPTHFFWDTDAYYMEDDHQEAGYHLRAHQTKSYFQPSFKQPFQARIKSLPKEIYLFEHNTEIGQVQQISTVIQQYIQAQGNTLKSHQAVIVLANEDLLAPLLYALSTIQQPVDVTLGYPIIHTTTYQLIEQLLAFQMSIEQNPSSPGYLPTREVVDLLQHPSIKQCNIEASNQAIQQLLQHYPTYVPYQVVTVHNDLYQAIFTPISAKGSALLYISNLLSLISNQLEASKQALPPLEKQALDELIQQFSHLQQLLGPMYELPIEHFSQLLRQLTKSIQLPLVGTNAIDGIPIMRIWETANLDFEYVFIIGMNEGILPAKSTQGSFIPYNLRKGYGLPTIDTFQASLDAYYFYRLLQRSKQVYITYGASSGAQAKQEASRYIWQLLYESNLPIKKHTTHTPIYTSSPHPILIKKDKRIIEDLGKYIYRPGRAVNALTPAAMNTYLDCSLKFYFHYILGLPMHQQLPRHLPDAIRFGKLLHVMLEEVYGILQASSSDRMVQSQDIINLKGQLPSLISQLFLDLSHQGSNLQLGGQQMIEQEIIEKVIHQLLTLDERYAPFMLVGLEIGKQEPFTAQLTLSNGHIVVLRGIIDRIDVKGDTLRVIDYKTGTDEKYIKNTSQLFDKGATKRNKAAFQAFFYSWLVKQNAKYAAYKVVPHLVNTRSIFNPDVDMRLAIQRDEGATKGYVPIEDIASYQGEFVARLEQLLTEILDPHVPFWQTENQQHCVSCPYQRICERY